MVNLKLTYHYRLSEFHPKQVKAVGIDRVDLSLWAAMAVSMIMSSSSTKFLIAAASCLSLITSLQLAIRHPIEQEIAVYVSTYVHTNIPCCFFSFGAGPERLLLVTVFSDGGESDFFHLGNRQVEA